MSQPERLHGAAVLALATVRSFAVAQTLEPTMGRIKLGHGFQPGTLTLLRRWNPSIGVTLSIRLSQNSVAALSASSSQSKALGGWGS
jgi:hypothetical protein